MFEIECGKNFQKQFQKLPKDVQSRAKKFILERISVSPHEAGEPLKGNFLGLWRARMGDYRIIYEVKKEKVIIFIIKIGHRKEIYS